MTAAPASPVVGYRVEDCIHESGPRIVLRAIREADSTLVVLKTLSTRYPRKQDLAELEREYEIARKLDFEGVIRVDSLVTYGEGNLAIVMEHFGCSLAEHLQRRAGAPLDVDDFFPIALDLAKIVGRLHERGVVHKDLVPRNILFDERTRSLRLIDFGISSELGRERPSVALSQRLEGSLPYLSPEQTGRMNRDLDYRSDYYTLGVTFFELLTGKLPFLADSPLEWVHKHISEPAPFAHETCSRVPRSLAHIVAKLMAKNAEDRYQSTFGLIQDLERARDLRRSPSTFPLGEADVSRRFQLPQSLYGRERELVELRERFLGVAGGETVFCLISGYSGVGKSALANELSRSIAKERGYLTEGKFDQFKKNRAYAALGSALSGLVQQVLTEPKERIVAYRLALEGALGANLGLMVEVIPELEHLVGKPAKVPELPPTEAQNRFQLVFVNLLKVFATREHPLVIFLDDLQWSDVPTLNLLDRIAKARDLGHLLLIGAYRSNSLEPTHPLLLTLDELRKSKEVVELRLEPLEREAVYHLVADSVHQSVAECQTLCDAVYAKADGNPLFLGELLRSLYEDGSLYFEPDLGRWCWNETALRNAEAGDNVVDFLVGQLRRLPSPAQRALYLAACIGNSFDLRTLSIIAETPPTQVAAALAEPLRRNLLVPLSDNYRYAGYQGHDLSAPTPQTFYKFQHDRVQQAAYELIPVDERKGIHLSVGRLIIEHTSPSELDERLIEVVGHLNSGRTLLRNESERLSLAKLNLRAAGKAVRSSAYDSALSLLEIGLSLVPETLWDDDYSFAKDLHQNLQSCAYLTASYEKADEWTELLLVRLRTPLEKAEALSARTRQYATMGRMRESITAAIEGLRLLGVEFSEAPGHEGIEQEVREVQKNLAGRRIADLIFAPHLASGPNLTAIRLLMEIFPAAFLSGSGHLFPYLVLKSVNLSLVHGNCPESAFAYAAYGMLLCGVLDNPALGYEYGRLALEMNETFDDIALKSRIIYVYAMFIHHFSNHWSTMTPWFQRGIESGYQSGDLLYLAYSAQDCIIWDPKLDLEVASNEQRKYLRIVKDCEYRDSYDSGSLFLQMQLNFRGLTESRYSMNTEEFDEERCLSGMKERAFMTGVANYHIYKTEIHYFLGDFAGALEHIEEQDRLLASSMSLPQLVRYYIVSFLTRTRLFATFTEEQQRKTWSRLESDLAQMRRWAEHCPANFEHLRLMMTGELHRLSGHLEEALADFEKAIELARSESFRRDEGFANELAARALIDRGLPRAADGYLRAAHYVYYRWGARAKVTQLLEAYPEVFQRGDGDLPGSMSLRHRTSSTDSMTAADLDLASVIKASQAISGEIVLDQFWKTTLQILLENAGGQRGRFLVRNGERVTIQAESGAWPAAGAEENRNLPHSLINSALRTDKPIVLHDASEPGRFSNDPYVVRHAPRSILCIPLRSGERFEGVIYLENNLTAGAFSADRVEVIKLLAAQAVISVENANLYENQLRLIEAQSRFVPSQFLESLGHHDIAEVSLGQYVATEMTVLFADLREFTTLAEKVGPNAIIRLLNRYFSRMADPITKAGGFVDSFIGDAIMALFGGSAEAAVAAAVSMHKGLLAFNEESLARNEPELRMGVGLNTGPLILGTVGSLDRLKCGVVGDTVNLASRIEQLTKTYQASLLLGEGTFREIEDNGRFSTRLVDLVAVKGKARAVRLYEVLDAEPDFRREKKERTRDALKAAQEAFFSRRFRDAEEAFEALIEKDPADVLFPIFAERARTFREAPPSADWAGVTTLHHK